MKKLLSICFVSILLTMMSWTTAQAQSPSGSCCFWIENMQPETFRHIANLNGTMLAQDTGAGTDLVLNNVLNRARVGNTDVYTLHFPTDCGNKVSIEWLLYRDGQLVNGNMSDYATFEIYTRYAKLNVQGECESIRWLGGQVDNGDGICGCAGGVHFNYNDFPGGRQANGVAPYYDESHLAAGYTNQMYTNNFDYFYLPFLNAEGSQTQVKITWKQVGNYSLVMRLRERTGGTDYDFTYDGSQSTDRHVGGHQSCCGDIIAQDSIHYLVTTSHNKSICDGSIFNYGRPEYAFSEESLYYVLFGERTCDHWKVERIDTFQLYTRINPNVITKDSVLCRNERFSHDDLLSLATPVNLNAPGFRSYELLWSKDGVTFGDLNSIDLTDLTKFGDRSYTFVVKQRNYYYNGFNDSINYPRVESDSIHYCEGEPATITITVRDLYKPIADPTAFEYCNENIAGQTLTLSATIAENDKCSDQIHWFSLDGNGNPTTDEAFRVQVGNSYTVDLATLNPTNVDKVVKFTANTYSTETSTYSAEHETFTITFHATPVITPNETQLDFVVCPGAEVTLESDVVCNFPTYNNVKPALSYSWEKNGRAINTNVADLTVNADAECNHTDTYTLTVTATTAFGCEAVYTRTYTVLSQDIAQPTIVWKNGNETVRRTTLSGCDSSDVPAPYATLADFANDVKITDGCNNVVTLKYTDVAERTDCQTIVTRTYTVTDACANVSEPIQDIFTINNDYIPTIAGSRTIKPVNAMDCKYNAPDYATLRGIFDTTITVNFQCRQSRIENVVFYLENTDVVADGNLDIFADVDHVTIYAQVTDACGNISAKTPVFNIYKPAKMYIAHGSISLDTLELCVNQENRIHFNPNFVMNAYEPYTYQWSQIAVVGQCVITPDNADNTSADYLNATLTPELMNINTSAHIIMTVTDRFGCVASDTANAVHFYRLPDVTITTTGINDEIINDGDTLCPNYGRLITRANANSNLPDSIPSFMAYHWTGDAIATNPYLQDNMFDLSCRNCHKMYQVNVEVANKKNCKANATFHVWGIDNEAPVVTAPTVDVRPLEAGQNCKIRIPDYTTYGNFFNNTNVSDNCRRPEYTGDRYEVTITQDIAPGTLVDVNTDVTVTLKTPCGPAATHVINVRFPDDIIAISDIASTPGCDPNPTTLTPTVINNTGTISYNWNINGRTVNTETADVIATVANHTYSLTVTDNTTGCKSSQNVDVTVYRTPVADDVILTMTPNHYCGTAAADGTVSYTVNDAEVSHIVGYKLEGDVFTPYRDMDYVYTNLRQGNHEFTFYTSDGCTMTLTAKVTQDSLETFTATVLRNNDQCERNYGGSVQVIPQKEDYVYTIISNTQVTDGETQTGLADVITPLMFNWLYQDTYRIQVATTTNCIFYTNEVRVLDITDTPSVHTYDVVNVTRCDIPNGQIRINNTNASYSYILNGTTLPGNNSTITFSGLASGNYTLRIMSAGKCIREQVISVASEAGAPEEPVYITSSNNHCDEAANGSLTIAAANTVQGYTYTVEGVSEIADGTSNVVFYNLGTGLHTIAILGVNQCLAQYDFNIEFENVAEDFADNEVEASDGNNCVTPNNSIVIDADEDYNYFVYDENDELIDPADYSALADGQYRIVKQHAIFKCEFETLVNVKVVKPDYDMLFTVNADEDCSTIGTGSIVVTNGNGFRFFTTLGQDTLTLTQLDGTNTYTVHAISNTTFCEYTKEATVIIDGYTPEVKSIASTANYLCFDNQYNGTITVTLNNTADLAEVLPCTYFIKNTATGVETSNTTGIFTGLQDGNYNVWVTSNLHCQTDVMDATVIDSAFIQPQYVITPNHNCFWTPNNPGSGCIDIIGPRDVEGLHDYTYTISQTNAGVWSFVADIDKVSLRYCFLDDATYHLKIVDALTGCEYNGDFVVPFEAINVNMTVASDDNHRCDATGNGFITVNATSDHEYSTLYFKLTDAANVDVTALLPVGSTVNNLVAGTYYVTIVDNYSNCVYDTMRNREVVIDNDPYTITFDVATTDNAFCRGANGVITISNVVSNNPAAAGFEYSLDDLTYQASPIFNNLASGAYVVYVRDINSQCVSTANVVIKDRSDSAPIISNITSNGHNLAGTQHFCQNTTGTIFVDVTSNVANDVNFTYEWTNSCHTGIFSTADTVNVSTEDVLCCDYILVVTSELTGCVSTKTVNVCIDSLPKIHYIVNNAAWTTVDPNNVYNCENKPVTIGINTNNLLSYNWTNGITTSDASFTIPAFAYAPGQIVSYCINVEDVNGCKNYGVINLIEKPISTKTVNVDACNAYSYTTDLGLIVNRTYGDGLDNPFSYTRTYTAANGCDSIVTYNVKINAAPTIALAIANPANDWWCTGNVITNRSDRGLTVTDATESGWKISDDNVFSMSDPNFNISQPLAYSAHNHKYLFGYAANSCDTVTVGPYMLIVGDNPSILSPISVTSYCAGADFNITPPSFIINADSVQPVPHKWELINGTDTIQVNGNYIMRKADNGKTVRFTIKNYCGVDYVEAVINVDSVVKPVIAIDNEYCAGQALNLASFQITNADLNSRPTDTIIKLDGTPYVAGTKLSTSNTKVTATLTYSCGTIESTEVLLNVHDTAHLALSTSSTSPLCIGNAYVVKAECAETNTISYTNNVNCNVIITDGPDVNQKTIKAFAIQRGQAKFTVVSTAEDNCGAPKTHEFTFYADSTPRITSDLANQVVCLGAALTSVEAPTYVVEFPASTQSHYEYKNSTGNWVELNIDQKLWTASEDSTKIRFVVTNECGTSYSNEANVLVNYVIDETNPTFDTICSDGQPSVRYFISKTVNFNVTSKQGKFTVAQNPNTFGTYVITPVAGQLGRDTIVYTATAPADYNGADGCKLVLGERPITIVAEPDVEISATAYTVCEGETLPLSAFNPTVVNNYGNIYSQGWMIKKVGGTAVPFVANTKMSSDYNNAELYYFATNLCGETQSESLIITVNDTAKINSISVYPPTTICNGDPIAIRIDANKDSIKLSQSLIDAGLSYNKSTKQLAGEVQCTADSLIGTITVVDTICPSYNKTANIKIRVHHKPTATLTSIEDACAGDALTTDLAFNDDGIGIGQGWYIQRRGESGYASWSGDLTPIVTAAENHAHVYFSVQNGCGTANTDTLELHVAANGQVIMDATNFRDTCMGSTLADFIVKNPVITDTTDATVISATQWYFRPASASASSADVAIATTDSITEAGAVRYGYTTQCGFVYSEWITLTFDAAPEFTTTFGKSDFEICENDKFTKPTYAYTAAGNSAVVEAWTITKAGETSPEEFDFNTVYDVTYNGATVTLTVSNACGTDTHDAVVTINALPVPQMLQDATLCTGETYTLNIKNPAATSTYKWATVATPATPYSAGTYVATGASLNRTAPATDAVLYWTVQETDANGCVSTTAVNASTDSINSNVITIKVTSKPAFVFYDMDGVATHDINTSVNNTTTSYKWAIDGRCYGNSDEKVFVKFTIKHNDTIIPTSEVGNYLKQETINIGYGNQTWNNRDMLSYTSSDGSATLTQNSLYETMTNHYPQVHVPNQSTSGNFDWLYLHFLDGRINTKYFTQFYITGDYTIEYELYATNGNDLQFRYSNADRGSLLVGGQDYAEPLSTLLAEDVFTIHVDNGPAYAEPVVDEPIPADEPETTVSEPTMSVYPNPATENVTVKVQGVEGKTIVRISTLTGKVVAESTVSANASKSAKQTCDVSGLVPGVYVVQIVNDKAVLSRKLVVTK
jgi:hypothetical protein